MYYRISFIILQVYITIILFQCVIPYILCYVIPYIYSFVRDTRIQIQNFPIKIISDALNKI